MKSPIQHVLPAARERRSVGFGVDVALIGFPADPIAIRPGRETL